MFDKKNEYININTISRDSTSLKCDRFMPSVPGSRKTRPPKKWGGRFVGKPKNKLSSRTWLFEKTRDRLGMPPLCFSSWGRIYNNVPKFIYFLLAYNSSFLFLFLWGERGGREVILMHCSNRSRGHYYFRPGVRGPCGAISLAVTLGPTTSFWDF